MFKAGMILPLLLLGWAAVGLAQRTPTEISTSAIIVSLRDVEADIGGGKTTCETIVANSLGMGAKKINFVPTIISLGTDSTIHSYGYMNGYDAGHTDASKDSVQRFQSGLQRCFKAAIDAGFTTLHITPHVDPKNKATMKGVWRNLVKFDPLAKYSGYSYSDVLLQPVARALAATIRDNTVVEFSVSAEQGLSTWMYPQKWLAAIQATRAITARGRAASKHLYGVSFNWDKICGCVEPSEPDPILYNQTYLERFKRFTAAGGLKTIDVEGIKQLLQASDFIGMSGYASLPVDLATPAMEVSIQTVAFELQSFNISLADLALKRGKRIIYSEQGLGGYKGGSIAPSLFELAKRPFQGKWPSWGYSANDDPWRRADYREYRRALYRLMSSWAAQGGGPLYRIDGVYVWSVGTWDVHGVHPAARAANGGGFADEAIRQDIRRANSRANAAAGSGDTSYPGLVLNPTTPQKPGASSSSSSSAAHGNPKHR